MKKNTTNTFFLLSYIGFTLLFIAIVLIFIFFSYMISQPYSSVHAPKDESPVVIIDAGHGGEDGGTIGVNGCYEKDINLEIAKKLKIFLSGMGIKSVLTRDTDILLYDRNQDYQGRKKHLDMLARLEITNSYENAIFVSIHQNAFPQEKYSGFQIYYSPNNENSEGLAKLIEADIKEYLQPDNNRKAKMSAGNIYLLDKLNCPAVLLECGFLSNSKECELLCSDEYQNKLCAVIAEDISKFLNE